MAKDRRYSSLNFQELPPEPAPNWGYTTFTGQPVNQPDPAALFDRSERSGISSSPGEFLMGNTPATQHFYPGGGPEGMVQRMIKNQINPLSGAQAEMWNQAMGRAPMGPGTMKGVPQPPMVASNDWRGGKPAPPVSVQGGAYDLVSMPSPLARPATPPPTAQQLAFAPAAIPPMMLARAEIAQTPRGSGPGAPIPVPFTSAEVRAAARFVFNFTPAAGPATPGGPYWVIAEKTAEVLQRWGTSRGWVRVRAQPGGPPRTFNLADKVYDIARGSFSRLSGLGADTPPASVTPIDLESATTTWDTEQFRAPEQSGETSWVRATSAVFGDGPGGNPLPPELGGVRPMPIGPGTQVTGARSNLNAYMTDALDAAYAAQPAVYGATYGDAAPSPEATGLGAGALSFFPLLQAHPIKKKSCNCGAGGGSCRCGG